MVNFAFEATVIYNDLFLCTHSYEWVATVAQNMSLLGHVSKIVSILLSNDTSLCYCNDPV